MLRGTRRNGRVATLGAVAALLLAGIAAGCGGSSGGLSPEEILSQSADRTAAVESFHVLVSIENVPAPSSGLSLTFAEGDVDVPDRLRARINGTFQGVPLESELIVVGDSHWLKIPFTGQWQEVDVTATPVAFLDPNEGVLSALRGATDLSEEGSEEVDGVDAYVLEGRVQADAVRPLLGTEPGEDELPVELWIGKDDFLLRRLRLTGPASPDEGDDAVRTVELSAFDEPVEIEAPTESS